MTAPRPAPPAERLPDVGGAVERGWNGLQPLLEQPLVAVSGLRLTVGGLLFAVAALLVAWLMSVLLRRAIARYGRRYDNVNAAALYTVSRLVHYVLLVVGFLVALDLAGIPVTKFAIFAGAIGVGLGFGLQAIFSNFISGLILLFDRSLKVGDFVQLDDNLRGTVRAINIRATLITTNDNIDVIVPNSEFVSGRVVNWTHGSIHRRIRVRFGVAYGVDKELVKKAALEAAAAVPFTLATEGDRRPQVWLVGFGDSAVEFILAVWLNEAAARRNAAIEAAYLWELDTAFKRHGIEIPFPQRDLHLRSLLGLHGEAAFAALRGEPPAEAAAAPDTSGDDDLSRHERAALAGNDAQQDVEREIAEDAAPDAPAAPPLSES
ncbi:mechanosensitive ion channel family protein [Luteimonas suaedae]|uniref:mechanosensitive ion channel family protein n=1 Tax=Luteimonas suaedae TaxID=2605430 RepID=UPI0011ECB22F|nr:mechanosensitive ion channel domain-containing protein [Luteimonas suaedae]